jgi:hypothetical protein
MSPLVVAPQQMEAAASKVASAAVQLTANPLEIYGQAISTALADAAPIVERVTDIVGSTLSVEFLAFLAESGLENATAAVGLLNPLAMVNWVAGIPGATAEFADVLVPFVGDLLANLATSVPAGLTTALGLLAAGDVEGAINTIVGIPLDMPIPVLIGLLGVLTQTSPFLEAVLPPIPVLQDIFVDGLVGNSLAVLLGGAGPLVNLPGAIGAGIQGVIDAALAGDPLTAAAAVVAIPGLILDGVLNGGYGPASLLGTLPGLLSPGLGTLNVALNVVDSILSAMGFVPPAAVAAPTSKMSINSVPDTGAAAITVKVTDSGAGAGNDAGAGPSSGGSTGGEGGSVTTDIDSENESVSAGEESTAGEDATGAEVNGADEVSLDQSAADDDASGDDDAADTSATDGNKTEPGSAGNGASTAADNGSAANTDTASAVAGADSNSGTDSNGGEG